jgi:secondary thiamine-phosphate synthase enzyme
VHEIRLRTARRSHVVDITRDVREAVGAQRGCAALVYVPHTTAGVTINERADPAVARDLEAALERVVDDGWPWQHFEPGEENAPTHVRAALMGQSVVVPLREDGSLCLGTWQGIFFCEFDGPRDRTVFVSVLQ